MSKMFGYNLGSGQRPFTSNEHIQWVNIDSQSKYNPDLCVDLCTIAAKLYASADYVVLHHVLEHFGCNEAAWLITLCKDLLRPGGSVIITVPDMPKLVRRWLNGELDNQLFMTNVYGAYMGSEDDRHKWGYCYMSLVQLLLPHDFRSVRRFDFRDIPGADIAQDDRWILGVECTK